ncbi:MAG: ATP-dependent DNA helicase RecG, partial [Campylobacter sp.]|nr:ATP-dependent DNA helicase RecG [Campylobacter sp.]
LLSSQGEDEKESLTKNSRIPKQKGEQNDEQEGEQILSQNHSTNARAHFLQFSATPIPRTLALINSRFVSYSFLKQMPFEKQILTKIIKNADFNALLEHIRTQIERDKQTIIVYPLVASNERSNYTSLEEAKNFWFSRFKGVYATHGKDKEKENIVANFAQNGNILLSTTIIEVGISLPRLSSIVVVGAERLGLASLHQLRGRVGRHGGQGWCFLFTKMSTPPQRLIDFCATLDGFEVANIDYKNRQGGDILDGSIQHGATFRFYELEEEITTAAQARAQI